MSLLDRFAEYFGIGSAPGTAPAGASSHRQVETLLPIRTADQRIAIGEECAKHGTVYMQDGLCLKCLDEAGATLTDEGRRVLLEREAEIEAAVAPDSPRGESRVVTDEQRAAYARMAARKLLEMYDAFDGDPRDGVCTAKVEWGRELDWMRAEIRWGRIEVWRERGGNGHDGDEVDRDMLLMGPVDDIRRVVA